MPRQLMLGTSSENCKQPGGSRRRTRLDLGLSQLSIFVPAVVLNDDILQDTVRAKAKAKAACRKPAETTTSKDEKPKRRLRGSPPEHVQNAEGVDQKRVARLAASQARADAFVQTIRASGIQDMQPPVGFTAKLH